MNENPTTLTGDELRAIISLHIGAKSVRTRKLLRWTSRIETVLYKNRAIR